MSRESAVMWAMTQCYTYDWLMTTSESGKFLAHYEAWKWARNKPTVSDKARLDVLQAHTLTSRLSFCFLLLSIISKPETKIKFCHLEPAANSRFSEVMLFIDVGLGWRGTLLLVVIFEKPNVLKWKFQKWWPLPFTWSRAVRRFQSHPPSAPFQKMCGFALCGFRERGR